LIAYQHAEENHGAQSESFLSRIVGDI